MEWISVKDRLPPIGVLVETKNDRVIGNCKRQDNGGWYLQVGIKCGGLLHPDSYLTHWKFFEGGG